MAVKIQSGESDLIDELWGQNESLCRMKAYNASNRGDIYNHHRDRCIQCGVTEDDILQVGFMALYEAVQAYKPDAGYKLLCRT